MIANFLAGCFDFDLAADFLAAAFAAVFAAAFVFGPDFFTAEPSDFDSSPRS